MNFTTITLKNKILYFTKVMVYLSIYLSVYALIKISITAKCFGHLDFLGFLMNAIEYYV